MANRIMLNQTSYHGAGAIAEIATEAKAHGFKKALVCSDPDLIKFNVTSKVTDILDKEGLAYEIYSDIKANPTIENVQHGVQAFKNSGADYIIAIGGGSSMDTSKAIGIIIANPEFEDVRSLEGVAPTKKPSIPIIAVPTTAGTGSEVTCVAVLSDHELGKKGPIVSNGFYPSIAMIDPELTYTLPPRITASTGIDVLCHALEGFWSKGHQPVCDALALHACEIVFKYLRRAYKDPQDKEARAKMAEASVIAGLAFTLPKTTSSHACSFPLTNLYHIPHGEACGLTLDCFARINAEVENGRVHEFARKLGFADTYALADAIHELKVDLGLRLDLKDFNLTDEQVAELVKTSHHPNMLNNPVEITDEILNEMYQSMR